MTPGISVTVYSLGPAAAGPGPRPFDPRRHQLARPPPLAAGGVLQVLSRSGSLEVLTGLGSRPGPRGGRRILAQNGTAPRSTIARMDIDFIEPFRFRVPEYQDWDEVDPRPSPSLSRLGTGRARSGLAGAFAAFSVATRTVPATGDTEDFSFANLPRPRGRDQGADDFLHPRIGCDQFQLDLGREKIDGVLSASIGFSVSFRARAPALLKS